MLSQPLSTWEVLGEEYFKMLDRPCQQAEVLVHEAFEKGRETYRQKCAARNALGKAADPIKLYAANQACDQAEKALRDLLVKLFHARPRSALCLSGGGVRSSTFCLGVLQGLARFSCNKPADSTSLPIPRLLADFDYLSTVSGGGYIGAWFSSWAARTSTDEVVKTLAGARVHDLDPEPSQVRYLRNYASFLNPKLGLTSADTWTLFSTVLRNIVLNWTVLLPLLAATLVIPGIFRALVALPIYATVTPTGISAILAASFVTGIIASVYMIYDLPSSGNARLKQGYFLAFCLGSLTISTACLVLYWAWQVQTGNGSGATGAIVFTDTMLLTAALIGGSLAIFVKGRKAEAAWIIVGLIALTLSGTLGGFLAQRAALLFSDPAHHTLVGIQFYSWLALPCLVLIHGIFLLFLVGATSKITEDEDREWWARSTAWFTIFVLGWVLGSGLVLYASDIYELMGAQLFRLTGATTLSGAVLSLLGFSPKSSARGKEESQVKIPKLPMNEKIRAVAIKLILPVFLILLIMTLAVMDDQLAKGLPDWAGKLAYWSGQHGTYPAKWISNSAGWVSHFGSISVMNQLLLLTLLAAPGLLVSIFINANTFSLHAMYRSRLIRTFLGASNPEANRAEEMNPFTGFDPEDNLTMDRLRHVRPMHVVNVALNLVKGDKLAWQQRKAESFTISPLHCGSSPVGYVPSDVYASANHKRADKTSGITLGGAMTISGAAASPNMGYHSSPLVTMVMTLFNARLGAWLANPGRAGRKVWTKEAPNYAVRPFIDEAFGQTTDTNAWVYLSDGGHFENLGLYEMVRRRCHNVIVVDGSADPEYGFEDLGNAVRKIYVDLGIPIEFHNGIPISKTHEKTGRHCAMGTIQYSCVDKGGVDGRLIYIKTSLNQNEPADVANYGVQNKEFPQQPTYELWFDESQFESYRRLGSHVVEEMCGKNGPDNTPYTIDKFFDGVEQEYLSHLNIPPVLPVSRPVARHHRHA